jgi:hypothetical protein
VAIRFEFTVDAVEAVVLGRACGVDVRQFPLTTPGIGHDPVQLAKLAGIVSDRLDEQGLSRRGRLLPQAREAITLFGEYRASVALTGIDGKDQHFAFLGLSNGSQAVTVYQDDGSDQWIIELVPDGAWARELAAILPEQPAGSHRRPLSVTSEPPVTRSANAARRVAEQARDLDETTAFDSLEIQSMVRPPVNPFHGQTRTDEAVLGELLRQKRWGSGRIVVSGRDNHGRTREAPPFGWLDTNEGRYLVHTITEPNGAVTTTYSSASRPDVADAIRVAIGQVY